MGLSQLLLAVASAVILRSEPHGNNDRILLSQIRDSPKLEGQVLVFISPRRWPSHTSRHWVPFSSSPMTHRAIVEVFEPASTQASLSHSKSKLCYDQRSVSQSVLVWTTHLGLKTRLLFIRQLRVCWCGAPSLMRGWVCRLQLLVVLTSAVILRSESRGTHDHILLSQVRDFRQPGGPGPHIYIPQEQGGPVIPPGTGFPFCRFLRFWLPLPLSHSAWHPRYSFRADPTENTASNNPSTVVSGGYLAISGILLTCLPAVTKRFMFLLMIVA
jgi:hypothetical protein